MGLPRLPRAEPELGRVLPRLPHQEARRVRDKTVEALVRAHRRERERWEAERRDLLDRIMVLAGHGAYEPAREWTTPEPDDHDDAVVDIDQMIEAE